MASQPRPSPLNPIWLFLITFATVVAAYGGKMSDITTASFESAESAVELAIGLVGTMALWLGIMRVAEAAGMMQAIARLIRPLMVRLFPEVPADHPAMGAMIMNMAANALGLGNAATPMGLKAMQELNRLNPQPGTATHAMCLFLAINTSSVTLLPLGVIAVRASAGASNPASIIVPSLIATSVSTLTAIALVKWFAQRDRTLAPAPPPESPPESPPSFASRFGSPNAPNTGQTNANSPDLMDLGTTGMLSESERSRPGWPGKLVFGGLVVAFGGAIALRLMQYGLPYLFSTAGFTSFSNWLLPILICLFLLYGYFRGVRVYEALTEGAKEGFEIAIRIIPFMVAIFVAIGMFRTSGALDLLVALLSPLTNLVGMPAEALPMALIRPLSGSGAFGLMSEIIGQDPNSFLADVVSVMQGSTETTFYVLAVYFGSVGILRTRYALPAALGADAVGLLTSVWVCHLFF